LKRDPTIACNVSCQEGGTVATSTAAALRWLIGSELARYREEARLSLNEASARTGIGKAKLHHLESGRQAQDPDDITTLLAAYGVPAKDIDRLTTLTGRADEATWWAPWAQVVPDWLKTYVGLEALAESAFCYQPAAIPGLLQTQEYAAAVTANAKSLRPDHGERFVKMRMARTRRLIDPERPLSVDAVIPEGALRLAVGTPEVRREQLEHLLSVAELPNVTVQVIRPEDGPHSALSAGGFVALDFGSAARPVVYIELKDGALYLQESDQVEAYTMVTHDLQQVAMSPEQSRDFIQAMLKQ
jgi:transcriptional regulator with XRE-family HTH domain